MGPPSCMQSVVDLNLVMRYIHVLTAKYRNPQKPVYAKLIFLNIMMM
jgi:hypothetical protein